MRWSSATTLGLSLSILAFGCSSKSGGHNDGGAVVIPPDMAAGVNAAAGDMAAARDMTPLPPPDLYGLPAPDHDPTLHPPLPVVGAPSTTSQYTAPVMWTVVWTDPAAKYGDYATKVNTFNAWMLGSDYWKATSEYGVGAGTAGGIIKIPSAPPAMISDSALQTLIKNNVGITAGWPAASPNLVIAFVLDPATTSTIPTGIVTPPAQSCVDFDGYHQKTSAGIAYLVNAFCFKADGVTPDFDNLTVTISHEAAEATTDADLAHNRVFIPGTVNKVYAGGGETGDMCLAVNAKIAATPTTTYEVQQIYSAATVLSDNAAPTGPNVNPCLPSTDGPYYGAAFWSGDTSTGGDQSVLKVKLAANGTGTGTFTIQPFAYDASVGPIEFFILGSLVPDGITFDPDISIRPDPANPNGPSLGVRTWGQPGSTTTVKVNFGSTYVKDGQPVQILVAAETQSKRINVWWASIQPQ